MWNRTLLAGVHLLHSMKFAPNIIYVFQCFSYNETYLYFDLFSFTLALMFLSLLSCSKADVQRTERDNTQRCLFSLKVNSVI